MNVVSFVDRDMVMHYFGGGIGHLKNAPRLQVPGFDQSSEEMAVDEEDDDDPCSTAVRQPSMNVVMNGGEMVQLEVGEDDEDDEDEDDEEDDEDSEGDEGGDQTDEDEDEREQL